MRILSSSSSSTPDSVPLLLQCKKDIEAAIKGLKYLIAQSNRIGTEFWPQLFKRNLKVVAGFQQLLGFSSLYSEELAQLYTVLTRERSTDDVPEIHLKDNGTVFAVCAQLNSYEAMVTSFAEENCVLWDVFQGSLSMQSESMLEYLKHVLGWLSESTDERDAAYKAKKKLAKLGKIVSPNILELQDIHKLEAAAKTSEAAFSKIEGQLELELPHVFALLQEFVDSVTSKIILQHADTCNGFLKVVNAFAIDFGLHADTYLQIIDTWESEFTATRIQLESLIGVLREKSPDLIDKEVQGNDETSNTRSTWEKLVQMTKDHEFTVKCTDHFNGLFPDYIVADPIVSFEHYFDSSAFRNDPFNSLPDHSHLSPPLQSRFLKSPSMSPTLPVLRRFVPPPPSPNPNSNQSPTPAQSEFTQVNLSGPASGPVHAVPPVLIASPPSSISSQSIFEITEHKPHHNYTPVSLPPPLPERPHDIPGITFASPTELSSESALRPSPHRPVKMVERTSANSHLRKLYNLAKNDVTGAPVLPPLCDPQNQLSLPVDKNFKSSISYDMIKAQKLIARLLKECKLNRVDAVQVKTDFMGKEPGDLSVKAGESIEPLTDLISYHDGTCHWTLCRVCVPNGTPRLGFLPSSHIY